MNTAITETIEQQLEQDIAAQKKFPFDPVKMYFMEDYAISDQLVIHQPSIQDYIDYGENRISTVIAPFTSNTTAYRVPLWDKGIDWNEISNMELCGYLIQNMDEDCSKIVFGEFPIKGFMTYKIRQEKGELQFLYNKKYDLFIDEKQYENICLYIQCMFNHFPPEEEFTSSKRLKQDLINNDKQKAILKAKELENSKGSEMLSLISFCLNHPGFKYKKEELRNVGIFEFMDSVQRLNIYESTRALYGGMYSGMCDLSKVDKKQFDFMRDINMSA